MTQQTQDLKRNWLNMVEMGRLTTGTMDTPTDGRGRKYDCGHAIGEPIDAEYNLYEVEQGGPCPACHAAFMTELRAGAATLTGTEKQVAYASDIRDRAVAGIRGKIADAVAKGNPADKIAAVEAKLADMLATRSEARWWIDNKTSASMEYLRSHGGT